MSADIFTPEDTAFLEGLSRTAEEALPGTPRDEMVAVLACTLEHLKMAAEIACDTDDFYPIAELFHRVADLLLDLTGIDPREG